MIQIINYPNDKSVIAKQLRKIQLIIEHWTNNGNPIIVDSRKVIVIDGMAIVN